MRKAILDKYHTAGKKLFLSLFGATEEPSHLDATKCANKLGSFLDDYPFDGVDIDYEDTPSLQTGEAIDWLITFNTRIK